MSDQPVSSSRRRFVIAASTATALGSMLYRVADAAELPQLTETDPLAAAMSYKAETAKVDAKKFPNHKPAQTCANCQFFQGDAGSSSGPCQIFPGKSVAAKGWCQVWAAKKP